MKTQCTAKAKSTGKRCARPPIAGATVCRVHGGAAPQVQKKARERLAELVDPAIVALASLVRQTSDKKTRALVARDILDRNDFGAKTKHEHSGPGGGPIATTTSAIDYSSLSAETLERIDAELKAAAKDSQGGGSGEGG